ncbi:MAG: ABC transporter substrate-binding protein [Candidatus Latescibacteria bacterium]|nr:ABC transporter substrate-binding protein [Candidatus Latescibacterota bacterium]
MPGESELIVAKPFGPSIKAPDPARGYNGWYTSEAGITETLFTLDYEMNLKPLLAESFTHTAPDTWEITLKKGIRFHDMTSVTATAVKWSFDRIIVEKSDMFNKRLQKLLDIKSITYRGDDTLIFETGEPNAAFLYYLTSPGTGIVGGGSGKDIIIGTGPFKLANVIPNEEMVVSRFDGYWGERSKLDRVHLKIIQNPVTRMLAFEAGQVDIALGFPENDVYRLRGRKSINIIRNPSTRLCFFFVRMADGPLSDSRIRQAINYALNRREIVDTVLSGIGGEVGASIFPSILPWSNRSLQPYPHDHEKALSLLAETGVRDSDGDGIVELNGQPLVLNMWTYEGRASLKPTLELVQDQLKRVGIATRLKITKTGSPINQAMKKSEVHLNLQMWNAVPQGDPDYFISNIFTTDAGSNFMGYSNAELDSLSKKGKTTFETSARKKIYDRIQEIIYNDSPVIVLYHKTLVSAVHEYVSNYRIHPAENHILTPQLSRK